MFWPDGLFLMLIVLHSPSSMSTAIFAVGDIHYLGVGEDVNGTLLYDGNMTRPFHISVLQCEPCQVSVALRRKYVST